MEGAEYFFGCRVGGSPIVSSPGVDEPPDVLVMIEMEPLRMAVTGGVALLFEVCGRG